MKDDRKKALERFTQKAEGIEITYIPPENVKAIKEYNEKVNAKGNNKRN